jgi:hypothetical protein
MRDRSTIPEFAGGNEETHGKDQSGWPLTRPKFEPGPSEFKSRALGLHRPAPSVGVEVRPVTIPLQLTRPDVQTFSRSLRPNNIRRSLHQQVSKSEGDLLFAGLDINIEARS